MLIKLTYLLTYIDTSYFRIKYFKIEGWASPPVPLTDEPNAGTPRLLSSDKSDTVGRTSI